MDPALNMDPVLTKLVDKFGDLVEYIEDLKSNLQMLAINNRSLKNEIINSLYEIEKI